MQEKINVLFWLLGRRGAKQLFLESVLVAHSSRRIEESVLMPVNSSGGRSSAEISLLNPGDSASGEHTCDYCMCTYVFPHRCGGWAGQNMHVAAGFLGFKNS